MNTCQTPAIFDIEPKLLKKSKHLNEETGFLLRAVYGKTERFKLHNHEFYELFLTVSGDIRHYVNGEMMILEAGSMVFMRPEDTHGYIYKGEEKYDFVNLAIDCDIVEKMLSYIDPAYKNNDILNSKFPPTVKLTENETASVLKKLNSLNMINTTDTLTAKLKVRVILLDIFTEYFCKSKSENSAYIPSWLEDTLLLMKKPENFTAGIVRMTEISGKTREHLSRSVKKYLNKTLTEYINDLRINYAANLLKNTNLEIADICFDSGFGNMSHFYAYFNKTYGSSPLKYRKSR